MSTFRSAHEMKENVFVGGFSLYYKDSDKDQDNVGVKKEIINEHDVPVIITTRCIENCIKRLL